MRGTGSEDPYDRELFWVRRGWSPQRSGRRVCPLEYIKTLGLEPGLRRGRHLSGKLGPSGRLDQPCVKLFVCVTIFTTFFRDPDSPSQDRLSRHL